MAELSPEVRKEIENFLCALGEVNSNSLGLDDDLKTFIMQR